MSPPGDGEERGVEARPGRRSESKVRGYIFTLWRSYVVMTMVHQNSTAHSLFFIFEHGKQQ